MIPTTAYNGDTRMTFKCVIQNYCRIIIYDFMNNYNCVLRANMSSVKEVENLIEVLLIMFYMCLKL